MKAMGWLFLFFGSVSPAEALPPGQPILSDDPLAVAKVNGAPQWGSVERIDAGNDRLAGLLIRTLRRSPMRYDFQVRCLAEAAIRRGDILLLSFSARTVERYNRELRLTADRGRRIAGRKLVGVGNAAGDCGSRGRRG